MRCVGITAMSSRWRPQVQRRHLYHRQGAEDPEPIGEGERGWCPEETNATEDTGVRREGRA